MQIRKVSNAVLVALLLLAATFAIAPPAAAQDQVQQTTVSLVATPSSQPIRPLSDFAQIPIEVTYNYPAHGAAFLQTQIQLQVTEKPPWVSATLSPSTVFAPVDTGGAQVGGGAAKSSTATTTLLVQTTADAPAFTQGTIKVRATAAPNGDLAGSSGETSTAVVADFFSILDATTPRPVVIARPQQQVDFPITVTNFGNAATSVNLQKTESSEGLQVVLPGTLTVDSKQQGAKDNKRDLIVSVQTPYRNGYINQPGVLVVDVNSAYALDTKNKGMSTRVSTLITTKGFFVPAMDPAIIMMGVGAMALALRRRMEQGE